MSGIPSRYSCDLLFVRTTQIKTVPFDLPNRNDRATQCWLRIEDEDVIETVAIYCTIAQAFLRKYIHDYNSRKITEDDVDVSLWNEDPLPIEDVMFRFPDKDQNIKDWKMTTVLDPITRLRIYVTQKALCKVIMYSREGVTNYKVDCDKVLYYVNDRTYSGATMSLGHIKILAFLFIALLYLI
ncbi:hypothetical protein RR48_14670 [Papilio machaon]|uniref:Uncharacterized protein n=1 Tax=Papilio machaon TaxID=76193 RepID=A0A194QKX9_PAPMA|nr:hypothetical protein RR48_14670 [Papilio machaon]